MAQEDSLALEFDALIEKWGSEAAVYRFLDAEFERVNVAAFQSRLSAPHFQIKPMFLAHGLMGERHSGADYEPAEIGKRAEIGIFTVIFQDEGKTSQVLAHELIHHWEHTVAAEKEPTDYPATVDAEISRGFSDPQREHHWRNGHSRRFIAKACQVAQILGLPVRKLLFG